jgi:hypothetical protein
VLCLALTLQPLETLTDGSGLAAGLCNVLARLALFGSQLVGQLPVGGSNGGFHALVNLAQLLFVAALQLLPSGGLVERK